MRAILTIALFCFPPITNAFVGPNPAFAYDQDQVDLGIFYADPQVQTPDRFDWRDNKGDFMSPIREQGRCGSCWAFAIVAVMEAMFRILADKPDWELDLSEQHLISCSPCDCFECAELSPVLDYIRDNLGVAIEDDFSYLETDQYFCDEIRPGWEKRAYRLDSWVRVNNDTASIKQKVLEGPVIVKFSVYQDFYDYNGGVYEHIWGIKTADHYGVIVGWNDDEACWIVRNSWGTDWGEDSYQVSGQDGWFRIKYEDSEIQQEKPIALKIRYSTGDSGCSCRLDRQNNDPLGTVWVLLAMWCFRRPSVFMAKP